MREIKFRAWDKDEDCIRDWDNLITHRYANKGDSIFNDNDYILEQFIGLTDRNNVEIFEGDIVRIGDYDEGVWIDDDIHAINYQGADGYPAFEITPHPMHEMNGLAYVFQSGEQDIEIIGNIHENPELLQQ